MTNAWNNDSYFKIIKGMASSSQKPSMSKRKIILNRYCFNVLILKKLLRYY